MDWDSGSGARAARRRWPRMILAAGLCLAAGGAADALTFDQSAIMNLPRSMTHLQREGLVTEEQRDLYFKIRLGRVVWEEESIGEHGQRSYREERERLEPDETIAAAEALLATEDLPEDLRAWAQATRLYAFRGLGRETYLEEARDWIDAHPDHPLNLNVRSSLVSWIISSGVCEDCMPRAQGLPDRPPGGFFPLNCSEKLEALDDFFYTAAAERGVYDVDILRLAYRHNRAVMNVADGVARGFHRRLREQYPDDEEARTANAWGATVEKMEVLRLQQEHLDGLLDDLEVFLADPELQEAHAETLSLDSAQNFMRILSQQWNSLQREIDQSERSLDFQVRRAEGEISVYRMTEEEMQEQPEMWERRPIYGPPLSDDALQALPESIRERYVPMDERTGELYVD